MECYKCGSKEVIGEICVWGSPFGSGNAYVFCCKKCMKKAMKMNGTATEDNLEYFKETGSIR